ncbi:vWA domain-containing protein [Bermanella sp. R86510]|uniref:vWA domain-containing protein n=1 Tax=unclassified Bermanella TaxID=2627862 RepID=UPI0037C819F3
MLSFDWPWLFILLPLPLLVYWFAPAKQIASEAIFAPSLMMLAEEKQDGAKQQPMFIKMLAALAWACLICAIARPIYVGDEQSLTQSDRNMMLAVDISKSMLEKDMQYQGQLIDRLQTIKAVVTDFVEKRKGDRLGLILFGEQAYIQTPLTFDLATLKQLLDEAVVGLAGNKTAIGDAIGLGVKRLQALPESNRVLILLTDGQNTAGNIEPLKAAELAAQAGVKVYTVGIGADELVVQGFFGPRRINPSRDLDEETLTQIAQSTGGQYYRARNLAELDSIYSELNKIEPIDSDDQRFRPQKSLLHFPLALGLLISMVIYLQQLGLFPSLLRLRGNQ